MECRSCQPNLISFSDEITSLVVINAECNSMDVIDLDFINAFDLLLHDSLIKKLALHNINKPHVNQIKHRLTVLNKQLPAVNHLQMAVLLAGLFRELLEACRFPAFSSQRSKCKSQGWCGA